MNCIQFGLRQAVCAAVLLAVWPAPSFAQTGRIGRLHKTIEEAVVSAVTTIESGLLPIRKYRPAAQSASPAPISLNYPVVLVHGIACHDRGKLNPWGRIPAVLQDAGVDVYYGQTDAWGSVESNAEILKATIDRILAETGREKVNIIAHSKGGIDSRYCIWKYNYGDRVASLTTIATPHHGSEVADYLYNNKVTHYRPVKHNLMVFEKMFGDTNPDIYYAGHQLTTEKMKEFNEVVLMDDRVYYQCVYSAMESSMDDSLFSYSHDYIRGIGGKNDGLVSEYSAQWGHNNIKIAGSISHGQISDQGIMKPSGVNVPEIYVRLVKGLSERGF